MIKRFLCYISLVSVVWSTHSWAQSSSTLIPDSDGLFYYELGGGADVPMPAFYDTTAMPIDVDSEVGLGFNCGAFNPVVSLTNSLNNMENSFLAVQQQVLNAATSAVTEFPLYELSRADPNLYNLITDAIAGSQGDISLATKSCQTIQAQIADGQNPYAHFAQVAVGHQWQQSIGTAQISGTGDIVQTQNTVGQTAGQQGVPWVDPDNSNVSQNTYAGGKHQSPIQVIHDTAMTGYNVIANNNTDTATDSTPSVLPSVWPTPQDAAQWITNVVGDQTVTTYNQGTKSSKPGVGLYPVIQKTVAQVRPKLTALVDGQTPITVANLQAISAPGIAVSQTMIQQLQRLSPIDQQNAIGLLTQNISALMVLQKASLALRLLIAGSHVPAIYSNAPAQKMLRNAMGQLRQQVSDMLLFKQAQQDYAINPIKTLVQYGQNLEAKHTGETASPSNPPMMQDGAIMRNDEDNNTSAKASPSH